MEGTMAKNSIFRRGHTLQNGCDDIVHYLSDQWLYGLYKIQENENKILDIYALLYWNRNKDFISLSFSVTKSKKAGLTFPVARVRRHMKHGRYAKIIGTGSSVYLASVLEYLVAEVLELSANAAVDNKKKRIIPRHIMLAVRTDSELQTLCKDVTISMGGVLPYIHQVLLPKSSQKRMSQKTTNEDK